MTSTPEGLAERGSVFWLAMTKDREIDAAQAALLAETCRVMDRLERLDQLLRGDIETWARIEADYTGGEKSVELVFDDALAEARQQQQVLRQMLTTLGVEKLRAAKKGGSVRDDIAARRAARRSAAASGE